MLAPRTGSVAAVLQPAANAPAGSLAGQARLLALAGRGDAAVATLLTQQQANPASKDIALALATAYEHQGNTAAAAEALARVAPYYPGDTALADAQCRLHALAADAAILAQCQGALWQLLGAFASGDTLLAQQMTTGNTDASIAAYTQATTAYAALNDVPVYYLQALWAEAARQQGYYAIAQRLAAAVVAAEPTYTDGYVQLAYAYYAQGQYQQAETAARQATSHDAMAPRPYLLLGLALQGQRRYEEALGAFQRSLDARYPERALLQQLIGDTYQRLGSTAKATDAYTAALAADDLTLSTAQTIYTVAIGSRSWQLATDAAAAIGRLQPGTAAASYLPLEVAARQGDTTQLIAQLQLLESPIALGSYLQGLVAQLQGNTTAARTSYAAAMQATDDPWTAERAAAAYLQL